MERHEVSIQITTNAARAFQVVADGAKRVANELRGTGTAAGQAATGMTAAGTAADASAKSLDRTAKSAEEIERQYTRVGAAIGTGIAGLAKLGQAATENTRQIDGLRRAYGDTANDIIAFANTTQGTTIFSNEEAREAAQLMAALQREYGLTTDQIKGLIATTADLATITGIGLADAAMRTSSAIRGETESAEYLGLALNIQAIDRQNLTLTMTNQEAAQFRLNALNEQAAFSQGAAGDAAERTEGRVRQLTNSLQDAAAGAGGFLGPMTAAAAPVAEIAVALPIAAGFLGRFAGQLRTSATAARVFSAAMSPVGFVLGAVGVAATAVVIGHQKATEAAENQRLAYQDLLTTIRELESSAARVDLRAITLGMGGDNGTQNPVYGLFGIPRDVAALSDEYERLAAEKQAAYEAGGLDPVQAEARTNVDMSWYRLNADDVASGFMAVQSGARAAGADVETYAAAMEELYDWHVKNWLQGPDMTRWFIDISEGMAVSGEGAEEVRKHWVALFEDIVSGSVSANVVDRRVKALTDNVDELLELGAVIEAGIGPTREITAAEQERANALGWVTTAAQEATNAERELFQQRQAERGEGRPTGMGFLPVEGSATRLPQAPTRDEIMADRAIINARTELEKLADQAQLTDRQTTAALQHMERASVPPLEAVAHVLDETGAAFDRTADRAVRAAERMGRIATTTASQEGREEIRAAEQTATDQIRAAERAEEGQVEAAQRTADQQIEAAQDAESAQVDAAQSAADQQVASAQEAEEAQVAAAERAADVQMRAAERAGGTQVREAEQAANAQMRAAEQAANQQVAAADRLEASVTASAEAQEQATTEAARAAHDARVDAAEDAAEREIDAARRSTERQLFELERLTAARARNASRDTGEALQDVNDAAFRRIQGSGGSRRVVGRTANEMAREYERIYDDEVDAQEAALRKGQAAEARITAEGERRIEAANDRKEAAAASSAATLAGIEEQAQAASLARTEAASRQAEQMRTDAARNVAEVERETSQQVAAVQRETARDTAQLERQLTHETEAIRAQAAANTAAAQAAAAAHVAAVQEAAAANTARVTEQATAEASRVAEQAARNTEQVRRQATRNVAQEEREMAAEVRIIARETGMEVNEIQRGREHYHRESTARMMAAERAMYDQAVDIATRTARLEARTTVGGGGGAGSYGHGGVIPSYGHGGLLTAAHGRVLVGEWGPELLTPPPGSLITPSPASEAMRVGGGITIQFNGPVYGIEDFRSIVEQIAVDGVGRALPAAISERRRSLGVY